MPHVIDASRTGHFFSPAQRALGTEWLSLFPYLCRPDRLRRLLRMFAALPTIPAPRRRPTRATYFFVHVHATIRQPAVPFCRASVRIEPASLTGLPFCLYA